MTQNKFVTRILLIFHKSSMILAIPAEWSMYMEIKKLLSHAHFSRASNSCIFIQVPKWHFDWVLRVEPGVSLSGCKSPYGAFTLS